MSKRSINTNVIKSAQRKKRIRKMTGLTLGAIMSAVAVLSGFGGILNQGEIGLGAVNVYAKEIGKKNQQACDACEDVIRGDAPAGYTAIPDGINVGSKSVYRGGSSLSGWNDNTFLDDDENTFAKPLPYGNVYIDTSKMNFESGNKNNFVIDIKDSRFKWISSGSQIKDAAYSDENPTEHISTTDPMGQGKGVVGASSSIAYVGEIKSYLPDIKNAATNSGHTNDITPEGEYLYRITYKNAATLPNGTKGDVVITATGAQIEASYTVDSTHPRTLTDGGSEYSYDKALIVVQEGNELAVVGGLKDSAGNYINEYETVAKTKQEVQAHVDAAEANGAKFNTDQYNQLTVEDKYIVHATGVILDLKIEIKDAEGQPVKGTISYAAHDLDIFTSQNAWGRPVTTGTDDDTKYAEGMTILSGAQSYALTPNYGKGGGIGNFDNISTGNQTDGWVEHGPFEAQPESPLLIQGGTDKANGVRFSSRGIASIRGTDGTFKDTPFTNTSGRNGYVVLASGQQYNSGGQVANSKWYTETGTTYRPNSLVRNLMLGKAKNDSGNLVTSANNVNYRYVYNGVGNALWKTGRNDNPDSFDTGFAVLLDSEKSELQWSGSYAHSGVVRTKLFDTTVFTYIEQTHGTGGGIYLENYTLSDDCKPVAQEGVVTMGKGADATVTAVPEEGYRVKEFQIGGEGLKDPKTYTLKDLGLVHGQAKTVTRDGITFEMNADGTVDVSFTDVQEPRHIHVDFDADYYFYKIWKGGEEPTKLNMTVVPYAYIFTDVTLPAPEGTDPNTEYRDTLFTINGAQYTASDGTKYVLSPNNTLESVAQDGEGEPLVTLPYVLKGNNFESSDGSDVYPVTVKFGVNFAMGDGTMDEDAVKKTFTVEDSSPYDDYLTVLNDGGDISPGNVVWKIKYPAEGVSSLGWPALPIETGVEKHNVNHVERNYWFATEEVPGWSMEHYDNSKAEAPGVVPTITGDYAGYYNDHMWAAASVKDYEAATRMIQEDNRTRNAFMSVFSKDTNTTKNTYGGEISNVPAVVVKAEKTWDDFNNQFKTRQDIWLHIDARVENVVTEDILPPQKLSTDTNEKQTVIWGDKVSYETDQENVKIITKLADIPLVDAYGQRVTYTHADNGSYPASNGITYWLNELVKIDASGKTITYVIRETLDAAGTKPVEKDKEAEGLIGYTTKADQVNTKEAGTRTEIGEGDDKVSVLTYEGKLKNELALVDFTVTKIWDDAPSTKHGDDVDPAKLKAAWKLYESDAEVADTGEFKLQPAAAEAYVKTGDTEVGTLETKNGSNTEGKVTTTFTWHKIPKYVGDGTNVREAIYSVKETQLENYEEPVYSGGDKALDNGTVTNKQEPPTPADDETWGLKGKDQTGEPGFEKGTADIETIKLIDPKTSKPTDEKTVDALDENGDKIGTYTLNDDGSVTFSPDEDFVGDPQPATLQATDKNGFEVEAIYQPHVIDDTETEDVSRTIHYIYSTDGSEASADVTQTATFTRKATGLDPDTHEPIWGDWELSDTITDVESPEIEGWNPSSELVEGFPDLTYDTKDQVKDVTVVYTPNPPEGSHKTSFGPKGAVQKGTPPFTEGTGTIEKYELIDEEGNVVDELPAYDNDGNEVGTYTIDTETGEVTFTPTDPDFVGTPTPATVRATDDLGETATGTYTPTSIENTETKTVTKTITHVYEDGTPVLGDDGQPLVTVMTLTFSREGEVDPDTGEITWPNWKSQTFDDWTSPDVEGYSPHKDASKGETVTPNDGDKEDQIVYKKDTFTVIYTNGSNGKSDGKGDETLVPYGDNVGDNTDKPNTVTPDEGYKFTGKYTYTITKKDGTVETGETDDPTSVVVTGDVVFTPVYEKLPEVTYIDPATGRVIKVWTPFNEDGTEPPAPENPERPGYTFDGWDREEDEEGNITYKAKWKPWKYTIKYDANGGEGTMETQNFTSDDGTAESKRNAFTRTGYKFTGFKAKDADGNYLKDADGNDLFFSDPKDFMQYLQDQGPDSEVTLEAQWEKLPHVTYIDPATGRVIQQQTDFLSEGVEPPAPANPTREGYKFIGWSREVDGEGNVVYSAMWEAVKENPTSTRSTESTEKKTTTTSGGKSSTSVRTGDETNLLIWIIVLLGSASLLMSILTLRRRN